MVILHSLLITPLALASMVRGYPAVPPQPTGDFKVKNSTSSFPTHSLSAVPDNATAMHKNMTTADFIAEKKKEWEKARSDAELVLEVIVGSNSKELDELWSHLGKNEEDRKKERDEL
ncbi:hypothetical protein CKM354_000190000 [Cercospora kikuchii]|uniref:Uncharacterized protein n=1 Tax=Cercospora kikuchii TaxID=84275 RepID=A0A9P3C8Y6_9PEZI|nr:uncharacterized protein CKM354_000190000 [Cercospora kikuchii]GIZ38483.1 hypothetical protein CKM354_000190000 [Cercospora kikuchii]